MFRGGEVSALPSNSVHGPSIAPKHNLGLQSGLGIAGFPTKEQLWQCLHSLSLFAQRLILHEHMRLENIAIPIALTFVGWHGRSKEANCNIESVNSPNWSIPL
jgi:hypothetical protein